MSGESLALYHVGFSFPERITDVGVLFDLLIHDLDILNTLLIQKFPAFTAGGSFKAKHEDQANVILRFKKTEYIPIAKPIGLHQLNRGNYF